MLHRSMKAIVNFDEKIGKTVGRQREIADSFEYAMGLQKIASQLLRATGRGLCPKGVFKFKTHEEADAWMLRMLARPAKKD